MAGRTSKGGRFSSPCFDSQILRGIVIFTYMNGWFLWLKYGKGRQIYQSHGILCDCLSQNPQLSQGLFDICETVLFEPSVKLLNLRGFLPWICTTRTQRFGKCINQLLRRYRFDPIFPHLLFLVWKTKGQYQIQMITAVTSNFNSKNMAKKKRLKTSSNIGAIWSSFTSNFLRKIAMLPSH